MPTTIRKPARPTALPTITSANARKLDEARARRRPRYLAGSVTVECRTVGRPVTDPFTFGVLEAVERLLWSRSPA